MRLIGFVVVLAAAVAVFGQETDKYLPSPSKDGKPWEIGDKGQINRFEVMTVLQVVDESNLLVRRERFTKAGKAFETIWVKTDTEGIVDDRPWKFDKTAVYKVTGTKKYETSGGGTKTVLVLEKLVEPEPEP
jgi:hypothetical protein